jgi:hypothetical protein
LTSDTDAEHWKTVAGIRRAMRFARPRKDCRDATGASLEHAQSMLLLLLLHMNMDRENTGMAGSSIDCSLVSSVGCDAVPGHWTLLNSMADGTRRAPRTMVQFLCAISKEHTGSRATRTSHHEYVCFEW